MLLQLLCLLCLSVAREASSTSVHEVLITVRSVKSIVYRGMQVSIFEHTQFPRRYFFQPLSFLDSGSVRLTNNTELKMTELHIDVYLWTDEFIQLVESHFVDYRSVEMLPLTEISLAWSKQAYVWLGENYTQTYRLLEYWKDGDKPHMRTTFTLFCDKLEDCAKLQKKFNESSEAVGHLFDLRYRIQSDNSRNFSLAVRTTHFLQSPAFQQLERFANQHSIEEKVIVSEQTVDELADQVYTAALVDLQRKAEQQFAYVDGGSRRAVLADLHSYLRTDPVQSLTKLQWKSQVSWPTELLNLRPDKLSDIFNTLFRKSGRQLVSLPNSENLTQARESLSPADFAKIETFVRIHTGSNHQLNKSPRVLVSDVCRLATDLGSHVAWDAEGGQFAPPASLTLFRVNLRAVRQQGILLIHDLAISFKVSEHVDPVHPLPKDTEFQSILWQRHFAESFCILANRAEPPGMHCRVLSYILPTKSLQRDFSNLMDAFRPRVSYQGGHIGQNHFYQVNPTEFSFRLKICCTKDLNNP